MPVPTPASRTKNLLNPLNLPNPQIPGFPSFPETKSLPTHIPFAERITLYRTTHMPHAR